MAVSVEEAIAALATFSMEDDQPDIQGLNVLLSTERHATNSPIEYADVSAYRLSLVEDTKAINQLNSLIVEGREMSAVLYTYRSCVKALPQLPGSMKQSQAELYLETYQVLDLEMSHLREIQRWQASAASKLATDMQRFSRPERRINGPTTTHLWSMIKLLDVLVSLDHLKNAKASIPNDFSWYKRTFTQVSVQWQDTDCMREELDDLQIFLSTRWAILLNLHVEMFRVNNMDDILQILILFCVDTLELDVTLLFPERHMLLRVLPVLVVLATSSEKDSDSLFKRVKINRLINVFKNDPVIPAFPDLHLSPVAMLKELAMYFQKFASQARLLSLPALHEIPPRETQDYQRHYLIINHIGAIRTEHNDFAMRFASVLNQIVILKQRDSLDTEWGKEMKGNMYNMVVEGFQLLSRWTGSVWEQCAWKFSHPCKNPVPQDHDSSTTFTDYEKVVRWNYTLDERKALVELISYIKSVGAMMQKCDTVVADALWETIHGEVQDFVQNRLAIMLKTTFRKKKDLSRILSDMRTISADWMSNASNPEHELQPGQHAGEEGNGNNFHPRAVAPTAAQVHSLQFLVHELVSGSNLRKSGGLFGNNGMEIPPTELKLLESFFQKLTFFLHIMDYTATITTLTDLGFLWFREFYLETSRVIQFPIECSLPWMLVDHVIESQDSGLFESVLIPFDIYCDSAQHALAVLKQRFLYDEIEAEVDLCFDQLVFKISENIFTYYKIFAASKFLDPSFIFASDNGDKYYVSPARFDSILKMRRMSTTVIVLDAFGNIKAATLSALDLKTSSYGCSLSAFEVGFLLGLFMLQLLGRTVDLRSLITHRMNKLFRENLDFLFERFESQDICSVVELQRLIDVLELSHKLLSEELALDSFVLILREMQENISLVSFSSRLSSQILTEMQNDFLPNFVLCNTTQRFVRLRKAHQPHKSVIPLMKLSFYCGSQELNAAYQGFAQLYSEFFGLPHIHAIVKLLGTRSIPWLIRGLLDLLTSKIASLEPKVTILQGSLPKAIGLLPFDGGIPGCVKFVQENLNWASKSDSRTEILQCLKEIGSIVFLMGLLDIAVKEVETKQFMQIAPWLGLIPGADGQIQQSLTEAGESPIVHLYKSVISAIVSSPKRPNAPLFTTLSKQAEATDLFYRNNLQTGSVLEYTLAFVSAELDRLHGKWNAAPKTGFIDITTTRDFYRIFSGLQLAYLEESSQETLSSSEVLGDSVAWGGCTIIYLLGQQLHFELFDFSYQLLNVAEVESVTVTHSTSSEKSKNSSHLQGWDKLIESAKKARRLNNHVFSMLKARCPLEEKMACAIKQSGAPLHRVKYENTISAFETLPQKGA